MKRIALALFALSICVVQPFRAVTAQQPKIDEFKMTTYQAVFVTTGPKWVPESPEVMPLVRAHREYITGLLASGKAHVGGPFRLASLAQDKPSTDADLRGVYIVSGTADDAKAIAASDPGVKDGRYAFEIVGWMGPEGWFQTPVDVAQTETLYFGFLLTGPNTAAISKEETQTLMRGHLDYMDGQSKLGKLVMAGPLVNAAPRRGLIVYRVSSMAEAVERASADPMVKAGRMTPVFYEWIVPRGILK
jgi:uncharacterized protein YciI